MEIVSQRTSHSRILPLVLWTVRLPHRSYPRCWRGDRGRVFVTRFSRPCILLSRFLSWLRSHRRASLQHVEKTLRGDRLRRHLRIGIRTLIVCSLYALCGHAQQSPQLLANAPAPNGNGVEVSSEMNRDVSPPLKSIPPVIDFIPSNPKHEVPIGRPPHLGPSSTSPDTAAQFTTGVLIGTTNGTNLLGVGEGFLGPSGTFHVNSAPSDSNGAVGATQFVQWVNEAFAVFDKSSSVVVYGPAAGNTLWSGFGGGCESNNDGDPIVQYDKAAKRWIMTQFSVSTQPYLQCVAVSTTSDATGPYFR